MVQLKYFGDSRDYFKYDLIQTIFQQSSLRRYVFVPMLTEHREDNEGRTIPKNRGDKSEELLAFIISCPYRSLSHWQRWLQRYVESYECIEPVDETFFSDSSRPAYWAAHSKRLSRQNALIFVDPDTGLQTGKPWYLKKMGREKYILDDELEFLLKRLDPSSVLMLYQHLPKNKHQHERAVANKLEQVQRVGKHLACAYREDDLAFVFVSKKSSLHQEISNVLANYHAASSHCYKSLHLT